MMELKLLFIGFLSKNIQNYQKVLEISTTPKVSVKLCQVIVFKSLAILILLKIPNPFY